MRSTDVRIAEAEVARARHARSRVDGLRRQLDIERTACARLSTQYADEARDVEALERLTIRAVIARLRGRYDELLDDERAQAAAVQIEVAARTEVIRRLKADLADSALIADGLADAEAALRDALATLESEVAGLGGARAERLASIAANETAVRAAIAEIDEALDAVRTVQHELASATDSMSSAKSWSTYDTFFGGGVITSAIKHQHFETATEGVAGVQFALRRLRSELEDVPDSSTPIVDAPSASLRGMDIWFDNLFSDLMTHGRINTSLDRLRDTTTQIRHVRAELARRREAASSELAELEAERRTLLSD